MAHLWPSGTVMIDAVTLALHDDALATPKAVIL
jgi:hypothetical protein